MVLSPPRTGVAGSAAHHCAAACAAPRPGHEAVHAAERSFVRPDRLTRSSIRRSASYPDDAEAEGTPDPAGWRRCGGGKAWRDSRTWCRASYSPPRGTTDALFSPPTGRSRFCGIQRAALVLAAPRGRDSSPEFPDRSLRDPRSGDPLVSGRRTCCEELGYDKLMPPLVHKVRQGVKAWRDSGYAGARDTTRALLH